MRDLPIRCYSFSHLEHYLIDPRPQIRGSANWMLPAKVQLSMHMESMGSAECLLISRSSASYGLAIEDLPRPEHSEDEPRTELNCKLRDFCQVSQ